ncbi:uncharacterized protein BJX67DRAFT_36891 [Aspergillus lucknowensis]|uniref:Uncharacterized protein n=1 Tax=Aspergillus lucknowensis TaxID=176173 RepID=A0ABR4LW97_9EURO
MPHREESARAVGSSSTSTTNYEIQGMVFGPHRDLSRGMNNWINMLGCSSSPILGFERLWNLTSVLHCDCDMRRTPFHEPWIEHDDGRGCGISRPERKEPRMPKCLNGKYSRIRFASSWARTAPDVLVRTDNAHMILLSPHSSSQCCREEVSSALKNHAIAQNHGLLLWNAAVSVVWSNADSGSG